MGKGLLFGLSILVVGCGAFDDITPTAIQDAGAFAARFLSIQPDLPKADGPRQATLLTYAAMDDDLSSAAAAMVNAMETAANPRVHALAFADFQGPDNSFLFQVVPDQNPNRIDSFGSPLSPDQKEVTANDPAVLAATVNWAFSQYPGTFKAMDVFAHGGGYLGLGTDETQTGSSPKAIMSVAEFGGALRQGLKGRKLQLVNMLSCLMGNVEYLYELKDVADVAVASQDTMFATSHSVVGMTGELVRQMSVPRPDPRAIARNLAIFAEAKTPNGPQGPEKGYGSISAVDLNRLDEVRRTVNVLSNSLLRALPAHRSAILAAYDGVPEMTYGDFGNRDLWNFCNQLQRVPSPAVSRAALEVKAALRRTLLHTRDNQGAAANGLSICLPKRDLLPKLMPSPVFQAALQSRWAKATAWDQFILAIAGTSAQ